MDIQNNQNPKRTSWKTSPQSTMLAKQAKREFERDGKVTVVCPKCQKHPSVTTTSKGERTTVRCECGYVFTGEINL